MFVENKAITNLSSMVLRSNSWGEEISTVDLIQMQQKQMRM